jgi:hypothetical protein
VLAVKSDTICRSALQHIALNLLKQEKMCKRSIFPFSIGLIPGVHTTLDEHVVNINILGHYAFAFCHYIRASSREFAAFSQVFFML